MGVGLGRRVVWSVGWMAEWIPLGFEIVWCLLLLSLGGYVLQV
jgi:hypothetical protein